MNEGLYGVDCIAATSTIGASVGLAVLRDGRILGADQCGSVFVGSYEFDGRNAVKPVRIWMTMAYEGGVITGLWAGRQDALMDIEAALEQVTPSREATIDRTGRLAGIKLTYIGPLPV